MMVIPAGFYLVLHFTETSPEEARSSGWLFPKPPQTHFFDVWTFFDFSKARATQISNRNLVSCPYVMLAQTLVLPSNVYTHHQVRWLAIQSELWTMFSLSMFMLVLVPLRIPSLSLTTGEEADFNKVRSHAAA
ncbi:unnamed protein product, partial [Discosporangium mesarthrocarpum]